MDILTVDFETFYTDQFGFKKLTTEQYIRSPDFEEILVSVKRNDEEPIWLSGEFADLKNYFHKNYDWANSALLAHNTLFDGAILAWRFGIYPKLYLDTLCMARAIHGVEAGGSLAALAAMYGIGEKGHEVVNAKGKRRTDFTAEELEAYADYCINDVDLTHQLFTIFMQKHKFPKKELKIIDMSLRMFIQPELEIDVNRLEQHLDDLRDQKDKLLEMCGAGKEGLMSNPKFAAILEKLGVVPPTKISARTGKETHAFAKTDEGFKALLEHEDPQVQMLASARLGVKSTLEETRTERFLDIATRGKKMPVPIKYYAAHTGRWGGCLVADTEVLVYDYVRGVQTKHIVDVLLDDLVWDGEAFVAHEGVVFSGFSEVITWDGVTGTEDHVVFTDAGEISLRDAMQGAHRIKAARIPDQNDVVAARQFVSDNQE
jgi:DNA polymerase I-like protein with 3'-5' exonuclease and polymerase domains